MPYFKKIIQSNFSIIVLLCIMKIMLDYIYIKIVSPMYAYLGLTVSEELNGVLISWIMVVIYALFLIHLAKINDSNHKGAIVISVLICCSAIPTTTIVTVFNTDRMFPIVCTLYWFFIVLIYSIEFKSAKVVCGNIRFNKKHILYIIVVVLVLGDLLVFFEYTGFNVSLNLSDVYLVRTAFKTDNIPSILQYLFFASTNIFPILCVYELNKKRYSHFFIFALLQLLAFSSDGRKSTLFILILTIAGYYFVKNINVRIIPFLMTLVLSVGLVEKLLFKTTNLINYFIRRLFLLPAYLQYAYYDFFSVNEKDLFRQSIVGRLGFTSPYSSPIPKIIGNQYYAGSYANNGLFADAYSNLGLLGILLMPILLVIAFKCLDECSKDLSVGICIGVIFSVSYTLLSSSFFTVMLTHGFIISCIVIFCVPRFGNVTVKIGEHNDS